MDDVVKIVWGADFRNMGVPTRSAGRLPDRRRHRALLLRHPLRHHRRDRHRLAWGMGRTRFGRIVRAAAVNPAWCSALGINTTVVYAAVFAIGAGLAGAAGALSAPIRSVVAGAGVSILIESFIVTVIGAWARSAGP
jgi:branched-chain amino acid transport system permease protein